MGSGAGGSRWVPGVRAGCRHSPLPPPFPDALITFSIQICCYLIPRGWQRGGWGIFLAVLKAAGGRREIAQVAVAGKSWKGFPPPPPPFPFFLLLLLLLVAHLRAAAGLAPPSRRSPLFSPCRFSRAAKGAGGGRGRAGLGCAGLGWAGPAAPSPPRSPELAELVPFPRAALSPRPGAEQPPPPGTPMAPPRCSCPGSWISRRRATPGKSVGAAVPDPRCSRSPRTAPTPPRARLRWDGARKDLQKLLSASKHRASAG